MERTYREDIHAHYCQACQGYSECAGPYPGEGRPCLLTDSCTVCGRVLQGTEPVAVV